MDQLNYLVTPSLILVFAVIVYSMLYGGEPMNCQVSTALPYFCQDSTIAPDVVLARAAEIRDGLLLPREPLLHRPERGHPHGGRRPWLARVQIHRVDTLPAAAPSGALQLADMGMEVR